MRWWKDKEVEGFQNQQKESRRIFQKDVQAFGIDNLSVDNLDQIQEQLTVRRDQWVAHPKGKAELDQNIAALELQTRHQAEQIQKSDDELKKQQELYDGLLGEQKALELERQDTYGDKNPDDEELCLSTAIDSADKELEAARQKLSAVNQELNQLRSKIDELTKSIATRDIQLKSLEEAFLVRLRESGFASEDNYKAACLPESKRKTLAQQSQKLADEKTELTSKDRENSKLLETECQKLNDNKDRKQKQQERGQAIDAQKRECSRWDLLHELIGSADGKKYRNFVQGLTFEMMIGHANRQLQKMTDRYLLIYDATQPLELNVIDNYQAGEVRSTKNLSGGESFIVSLSLALGLSHMASKNVRVDSLFLDEGFGTLDEEALDTALETLVGLQQDGKLIGVISHVPALKECISTQIQVITQTGGRSLISGPGCGKVMQEA